MSLIKILFDDTEVNEPQNWKDVTTSIKRSFDLGGILFEYIDTLTFDGDAYNYLYSKFQEDLQILVDFELLIRDNEESEFVTYFNGKIFLAVGSNVVFNRTRRSVDIKITDDTFQARINNNKGIKAFLNVRKSKNEEIIDPAPFFPVDAYQPSGILITSAVPMVRLFDAFYFVVKFISDGTLELESDYLSEMEEPYAITSGVSLRGGTDKSPYVSFEDLFNITRKLLAVSFIIDGNVMKIEKEVDLYANQTSVIVKSVDDLLTYADESKIYSNIVIGDTNYEKGTFPGVTYLDMKRENYLMKGVGNTDNELNLEVGEMIYNSNVIAAVINGSSDYDDDNFLIQIRKSNQIGASFYRVKQTSYLSSGKLFYNYSLTNYEVIKRWMELLPQVAAIYVKSGDGDFYVGNNSLIPFNGVTYLYLAHSGSNNKIFEYNLLSASNYKYITDEAGNTLRYRYFQTPVLPLSSGQSIAIRGQGAVLTNPTERYQTLFNGQVNCPFDKVIGEKNGWNFSGGTDSTWVVPLSGYYSFEVGFIMLRNPFRILLYWKTIVSEFGESEIEFDEQAGIYQTVKHETSCILTYDQYLSIKNNKTQQIEIESNDIVEKGWIEDIDYNYYNGVSKITITNNGDNS